MDENKLKRSIIYLLRQNEKKIKELIEKEVGKNTIKEIKSIDDLSKSIKDMLSFAGIKTISDAVIKSTFIKGWEDAEKQIDQNILVNKSAIEFIQGYTFENIKEMTEEIGNDLRAELQRGIMAGEGISKLKARVSKVFDVGETRAEAISRTESNRAENNGKLQAFKNSGKEMIKEWVTHFDNRTSEVCKRLHGQKIKLNENFVDKKTGWEGPCPPSHVNCRSALVYHID
jgi:SPP1 gp7 family putative phage head morphogenesis protein